MLLSLTITILAGIFLKALHRYYFNFAVRALDDIPGPSSDSWIFGNLWTMLRGEAGAQEIGWHNTYGGIVKLKGPLGTNTLLISDPKALQYIYQTKAYDYPKPPERQAFVELSNGHSIVAVDGDVHKRQRRVLLPAFGVSEARSFVPIFNKFASQMVNKWQALIDASDGESVIVDMPHWTSRATLDALGEAGFDYGFDALENDDNVLVQAYQGFTLSAFGSPSRAALLMLTLMRLLPIDIVKWILSNMPSERLAFVKRMGKLSRCVSKDLVEEKRAALRGGYLHQDVLSLCVQANEDQNPRGKLNEEELYSQLQTLLVAGHDTTSTATVFTIYELARRPDVQDRLRAEILQKRAQIQQRVNNEWVWKDFEEMPYLNAVVKEVLRFHNPVPFNFRSSTKSDVIPLTEPITTTSGKTTNELPVPAGTTVLLDIGSYNRNPAIFGPDADKFNPDRWLDSASKAQFEYSSLGVLSNMLTFGAGARVCLGWRFAFLEIQALLAEMVGNFKFSHIVDPSRIRRETSAIMGPIVEGEESKGLQLPIRLTRFSQQQHD